MWARRTALAAVLLGAMACSNSTTATPPQSPAPPRAHVISTGIVTGGIIPCAGLAAAPSGLRYAAGTVTVLSGRIIWPSPIVDGSGPTFPTTLVVTQRVATNQTYGFELPPGPYVLQAHFATGNIQPFTQVTAVAGATVHADIPNMCE